MTATVRNRRSRVAAIVAVVGIALAWVVALPAAARAAVIDIGAVETPAVLPATGDEFNIWLPIVGGTLLLGGIAAVVVSAIRRRRAG